MDFSTIPRMTGFCNRELQRHIISQKPYFGCSPQHYGQYSFFALIVTTVAFNLVFGEKQWSYMKTFEIVYATFSEQEKTKKYPTDGYLVEYLVSSRNLVDICHCNKYSIKGKAG